MTTQDHFCKEHNTKWFKSPNMKNYAHPVKDADGNQIYDAKGKPMWCSEPKPQTEPVQNVPQPPVVNKEAPPVQKPTTEPPAPQEIGMWWKEVGDWMRKCYIHNKELPTELKSFNAPYINRMAKVLLNK
jgi:hypothetical protein